MKRRDLGRLVAFYRALYGHDRPEEWYPSVTREFVKQLQKARPAPATIIRTYASVRQFARRVHKLRPFPLAREVLEEWLAATSKKTGLSIGVQN